MEKQTLKKSLQVSKLRIYAVALLLTGAVSELIWTAFNAVHRNREFTFTLLYMLLLLTGSWLVYRRLRRGVSVERDLSAEDSAFLAALHDQYLKRLLHSIALFFAAFTVFIGAELSFFFSETPNPRSLRRICLPIFC